jgi:hypothetical protein
MVKIKSYKRFFGQATEGLVQHWHCCKWGWTLKFRVFASLYFSSGKQISIWLFVVNFNFIFSTCRQAGQQRFRADEFLIPHLRQAQNR